ncbi:hypothetical protein FQN49_002699 [Arthroderma sp. PD_2]|nr:hypothetical protein FQN49_002699 [Arthroderma sp. PD_2]
MAALLLRTIFGDNPTTNGPAQRAVNLSILCLVMAVVAGVLVIVRFIGRYLKRSIGADDWTILAAFALALLYTALQITCVEHGLGKHTWEVSPEDKMITLKVRLKFPTHNLLFTIPLSALLLFSPVDTR